MLLYQNEHDLSIGLEKLFEKILYFSRFFRFPPEDGRSDGYAVIMLTAAVFIHPDKRNFTRLRRAILHFRFFIYACFFKKIWYNIGADPLNGFLSITKPQSIHTVSERQLAQQ